MQKIIFYQELQPKAADALWLHHGYDEEGNKKESISIDYIQNGVVRHIMDADEGGGGNETSDGYKAYIKINPSSEYQTASPAGLTFTSAADAAQSLGISEQDFLKICSAQMPMLVESDARLLKLSNHVEGLEDEDFGYIISESYYDYIDESYIYIFDIIVFKESSEADDSTKQYNVVLHRRQGIQ